MEKRNLKEKLGLMMNANPFIHLGDAVYSLLYRSIIKMEIPDDEILSDTALAREMSISRTPVRNALLRLQDDGLIVDASDNPILKDIYRQISPRTLHYRYYMFRKSGRDTIESVMKLSVRHHQSVKNAIRIFFDTYSGCRLRYFRKNI